MVIEPEKSVKYEGVEDNEIHFKASGIALNAGSKFRGSLYIPTKKRPWKTANDNRFLT